MNTDTTTGHQNFVIEGTHPGVSATRIETWNQSLVRVRIRPVPPELEAFFFGDREEALYDGPVGENSDVAAVVRYQQALLDANGQLIELVLTGPLPNSPDPHSEPPASPSSRQNHRLSSVSRSPTRNSAAGA